MRNTIIDNRYQIIGEIGHGGMGIVYRAKDFLTGDELALKRVLIDPVELVFASRQPGSAATEALRLSLVHEFKMLASLRHPHIIPVLDYGFDAEQQPYLTMTLLENAKTLDEAVETTRVAQAVKYLLQVLQALAYLHRQGILHRDVKPGNILVRDDKAYVLDFGLAQQAETLQDGDVAAGTLAYMAPEILHGHMPDLRADLYSIGIIAYELFTGDHPFNTSDMTQLIYEILQKPLDLSRLDTKPLQQMLVGRLLARDPDDRFASADAVIHALCDAFAMDVPEESIEIRESFLQSARFVGRESELTLLKNALDMARNGQGDLLLIAGESGVGKSRLLEELRIQAQGYGMRVLSGQAISEGGLSYQLWRNVLPRLILSTSITDEEATILQAVVPHIRQLLPEQTIATDIPDNWQTRLPYILLDMLRHTAQERPVLLIVEDLQWAQEGLSLLQSIAPSVSQTALLIVGSYRSDEAAYLPDELPDATIIPLQRLEPEEIRRLSQSMLGEAGQRDDVLELIEKETEGNVFFMVEVLRSLAENAGKLADIGRVTLPAQVFAGGIQRMIQQRLERLPEWAQEMLEIAAVAGRQLDETLLQTLEPEFELSRWLTRCAEAAVLEVHENQWRFAHDKLRESVLANLSLSKSQVYHRRVAETLETLHQHEIESYALLLTRHYAAAGDTTKEARYAFMAAKQIVDFSLHEARTLAERALELNAYQHFDNPAAKKAELFYLMGNILTRFSEYDAARDWQTQARDLYMTLGDEIGAALAINVLGEICHKLGQPDDGLPLVEAALAIFQKQQKVQETFFALTNLGIIHSQLNQSDKMIADFEAAYHVIQRINDPVRLGQALNNLAIACEHNGNQEDAIKYQREALALRRQIKHPHGIASSALNLADMLRNQGDFEQAEKLLEEALRAAKESGNKRALRFVYATYSLLYRDMENFELALHYADKQLQVAKSVNNPRDQLRALRDSVQLYLMMENYSDARNRLSEGLTMVESVKDMSELYFFILVTSEYFSHTGRLEQALLLAHFVKLQSGTNHHTRHLNVLLPGIQEQLSDRTITEIQQRATSLTLEQVLQTMEKTMQETEKHA